MTGYEHRTYYVFRLVDARMRSRACRVGRVDASGVDGNVACVECDAPPK